MALLLLAAAHPQRRAICTPSHVSQSLPINYPVDWHALPDSLGQNKLLIETQLLAAKSHSAALSVTQDSVPAQLESDCDSLRQPDQADYVS